MPCLWRVHGDAKNGQGQPGAMIAREHNDPDLFIQAAQLKPNLMECAGQCAHTFHEASFAHIYEVRYRA